MKNWSISISIMTLLTSCFLCGVLTQAQRPDASPRVKDTDATAGKPPSKNQIADRLRWLTDPDNRVKIQLRVFHAIVERNKEGLPQWKSDDGMANQRLHVGDYLTIEVRNTGPADVYVHLFDIDADEVTKLYPRLEEPFLNCLLPNQGKWVKLLDSGTSKPCLYKVTSPSASEMFKLIATAEPTNFIFVRGTRGETGKPSPFDALMEPANDRLKSGTDGADAIRSGNKLPGAWGTASIRFIATDIKPPIGKRGTENPKSGSPHTFAAANIKSEVDASSSTETSRGTVNVSVQIIDSVTRARFTQRKNYALIFGADDYQHWPHLNNPLHDAGVVKSILTSKYGFDAKVVANPTRQDVKNTLRQYQQLAYNDYDELFVYFAGHGAFDAKYTDQGYIITHDSPDDPDRYDECLSFNDLQQMLDKIPCKHIFLVLDTCYGGTYDPALRHAQAESARFILTANETAPDKAETSQAAEQSLSAPADPASNPDYVATLMGDETRLFLSSGKKEAVPDGIPGEGSPFARQLSQALRVGDRQKMLLFDDIKRYVFLAKPKPHASEFDDNKYGGTFVFIAH